MSVIVGRKDELAILESAYGSPSPQFIALYGRRRVGKTFLVRNAFKDRSDGLFFYVTGLKDGTLQEQLTNFSEALERAFMIPQGSIKVPNNWRDAFKFLTDYILLSSKKKIILFFDEFPWMATMNSRLLQMVEYFWNHYWSQDARIKLIVCGSSAGWIVKNIINNKGGLYNRVTKRIHLEPLNLAQTKEYLVHENIRLGDRQIADLYMVLGGIPFYLSQIEPGATAIQTIERLAFKKNSFLMNEFHNLYATLFGSTGAHIEIARVIGQHHYGIGQEELASKFASISSGGRLTSWLAELEEAGFIQRFKPFKHTRRGVYYKMVDEYSLFYFRWIEPIQDTLLEKGMRKGYWERTQSTQQWYSWAGYAFEALCYKHIPQISIALSLSPTAIPYAWRYVSTRGSKDCGAQIDLLFDRDDGAITLCEIKYSLKPYVIDKPYAHLLSQKIAVFKERTKTKKLLFLAFVSASGLKSPFHAQLLGSGLVTLEDLFKSE
jgi:hypothetical protein